MRHSIFLIYIPTPSSDGVWEGGGGGGGRGGGWEILWPVRQFCVQVILLFGCYNQMEEILD